eukprot:jgi/Tetstr1/424358/TSEL_014920.t1
MAGLAVGEVEGEVSAGGTAGWVEVGGLAGDGAEGTSNSRMSMFGAVVAVLLVVRRGRQLSRLAEQGCHEQR